MIDLRLVLQDVMILLQPMLPIFGLVTGLYAGLITLSLLRRTLEPRREKEPAQKPEAPEDPEAIQVRKFRQLEFRNRFNAHKHWVETHRKYRRSSTNDDD